MPKPSRPTAGKPPKELRGLADFLAGRGYTLALPFDDVRHPGYIGGYNDKGQEIIIDDGDCLKGVTTRKPGNVVLGEFRKSSKFSIKSFLGLFGKTLGLDFGFVRAKSVSVKFPKHFVQTEYITVNDLEEHWDKISVSCRRKISNPDNFLLLQVLVTDTIAYQYDTQSNLDAQAKVDLEKLVAAAAKVSRIDATVGYEAKNSFTIELAGKPVSVAYKTATMKFIPLPPDAMVKHRLRSVS